MAASPARRNACRLQDGGSLPGRGLAGWRPRSTVQRLNKSNRAKYSCTGCAARVSVWGRPGLRLMCGECSQGFLA